MLAFAYLQSWRTKDFLFPLSLRRKCIFLVLNNLFYKYIKNNCNLF